MLLKGPENDRGGRWDGGGGEGGPIPFLSP